MSSQYDPYPVLDPTGLALLERTLASIVGDNAALSAAADAVLEPLYILQALNDAAEGALGSKPWQAVAMATVLDHWAGTLAVPASSSAQSLDASSFVVLNPGNLVITALAAVRVGAAYETASESPQRTARDDLDSVYSLAVAAGLAEAIVSSADKAAATALLQAYSDASGEVRPSLDTYVQTALSAHAGEIARSQVLDALFVELLTDADLSSGEQSWMYLGFDAEFQEIKVTELKTRLGFKSASSADLENDYTAIIASADPTPGDMDVVSQKSINEKTSGGFWVSLASSLRSGGWFGLVSRDKSLMTTAADARSDLRSRWTDLWSSLGLTGSIQTDRIGLPDESTSLPPPPRGVEYDGGLPVAYRFSLRPSMPRLGESVALYFVTSAQTTSAVIQDATETIDVKEFLNRGRRGRAPEQHWLDDRRHRGQLRAGGAPLQAQHHPGELQQCPGLAQVAHAHRTGGALAERRLRVAGGGLRGCAAEPVGVGVRCGRGLYSAARPRRLQYDSREHEPHEQQRAFLLVSPAHQAE